MADWTIATKANSSQGQYAPSGFGNQKFGPYSQGALTAVSALPELAVAVRGRLGRRLWQSGLRDFPPRNLRWLSI